MRALRRFDLELLDAAFDDHLRFRDVVPFHGDAQKRVGRAPAAGADEDVGAFFILHPVVEFEQFFGDLFGRERVERVALDVDDVCDVAHHADPERVLAVYQRVGNVHLAPVDRAVVLVVDDRADLEQVEYLLFSGLYVHIDGEFDLYGAAHLLGPQPQDIADDVREREGVVLQYIVERDDFASPVERAV